jgi:hypothetical protein
MMRYAQLSALALLLMLIVPSVAWACPACLAMADENRVAFAQTAVALSLLPLGMVGSVGIWLRGRARDNVAEDVEGENDQD